MKLKIGAREISFTIRDVIYIFGLIGVGTGWFVDARITNIQNKAAEAAQDVKIAAQAAEIADLRLENQKNEGYAKENANNIDWLIAIVGIDIY